jgi:hypothetical protein
MKNKKIIQNIIIFIGYFFSILGGIIGIIPGLVLLRFDSPQPQKHARMIIGSSIATTLLYVFTVVFKLKLLGNELFVATLIIYFIVSGLAGGFLAQKKQDYFTRGFFLALFTGMWGLIALVFAAPSRAKDNKPSDKHYWPREAWISIVLLSLNLIMVIFAGKIIH